MKISLSSVADSWPLALGLTGVVFRRLEGGAILLSVSKKMLIFTEFDDEDRSTRRIEESFYSQIKIEIPGR